MEVDPYLEKQRIENILCNIQNDINNIKGEMAMCAKYYDLENLRNSNNLDCMNLSVLTTRFGNSVSLIPTLDINGRRKTFTPIVLDNVYNMDTESTQHCINEIEYRMGKAEESISKKEIAFEEKFEKIIMKLKRLDRKYLDNAMHDELEEIMNDLRQSVN